MATVGRNDPCPCGSGKKHKQCCLGKPAAQGRRRIGVLPILIVLIAIGGAVYLAMTRSVGLGVAVGAGGVFAAGILIAVSDPPPPSGRGDQGAAINFGK